MTAARPKAVLWGRADRLPLVYPEAVLRRLEPLVEITGQPESGIATPSPAKPPQETEFVLGTWGTPRFDAELLGQLPNLRGVFYGAGTIRSFVTDELWEREIPVVSAAYANAVPVVDYAVSVILLALKRFFLSEREFRSRRTRESQMSLVPGNYNTVVSLISFGQVARLLAPRLQEFGMTVLVYDPFLAAEEAEAAGVCKVELGEAFARGDVVSLHTPKLPETLGLIGAEHFRLLKLEATFVNTSRGAVVREDELIEFLRARPDVQAILDVTDPEPPEPDSPLYELPNVVLTPHIAGSLGRECERMGHLVTDELGRFLNGEALQHAVTREQAKLQA